MEYYLIIKMYMSIIYIFKLLFILSYLLFNFTKHINNIKVNNVLVDKQLV